MKKFFGEFKKFIAQGNVIDLAVGVIIGGAFSNIVKSLVENVITPAISVLTKNIAFADLFYALDGKEYATLAIAQEAGAATINYGLFIQGVIDFIITAFVIFLMVKVINKIRDAGKKEEAPAAPTIKECPFCKSEISIDATRCPHCTSEIAE
ncbi:MAG: large conductance mechanosensitive channel protein MscL [Clostridia bacterium]|nr:large conductance mechanosensitive channel protein MscL [Clostridia bacterium]